MSESRYIVEVDMYVFAEDDEDAKRQAQDIAKRLREFDDNMAAVKGVKQMDFGAINYREVQL